MVNDRRVIFRADGNSEIGLGHVYRSLALAEILKRDFELIFVTTDPSTEVRELIENTCTNRIVILDKGEEHEFKKINSLLNKYDIIILDGYEFSQEYKSKIKNNCKSFIGISDFNNQYPFADIVISHSPILNTTTNTNQKRFIGPEYAILRTEFYDLADEKNLTKKIMRFLSVLAVQIIII
jgi:spore coat polysaccharide biosynthesis predicted glycosyltransferase SpsG